MEENKEIKVEKKESNNNGALGAVVCLLLFVIGGLIGYVVGIKTSTSTSNNNSNTSGTENGQNGTVAGGDGETVINNWVDYLLAQDLNSIVIVHEYNVTSTNGNPDQVKKEEHTITKEQLKTLLSTYANDEISKEYACGFGGMLTALPHLKITYTTADGTKYIFTNAMFMNSVKEANYSDNYYETNIEDAALLAAITKTSTVDAKNEATCSSNGYLTYVDSKNYINSSYYNELVK